MKTTTLLDQTDLKSAEEKWLWNRFIRQQHIKYLQTEWCIDSNSPILLKADQDGSEETISFKYTENTRLKKLDSRKEYYPDEMLYRYMTPEGILGSGSFGTVIGIKAQKKPYLMNGVMYTQNQSDKNRLMKIISTTYSKNNKDRAQLDYATRHEAELLKLIPYFHAKSRGYVQGPQGEDIYTLVMRQFEGETLDEFLKIPKTVQQCLTLSINLLRALQAFHDYQIAHLDVKPKNIIVDPKTLEIKLIDVGLSKKFSELSKLAAAVGSPLYVAPEGFKEKKTDDASILDKRSDLFSMGMIFINIWGGKSSRDAMKTGSEVIANLELPTYQDTFADLFNKLPNQNDLNEPQKKEIESVITDMIQKNEKTRIALEAALQKFEAIDCDVKLHGILPENQASFKKAYVVGGEGCRELVLAECERKDEKYILNLVLNKINKKITWTFGEADYQIFLERLNVHCLREYKNREDIENKLNKIYDNFNQSKQALLIFQQEAKEFADELERSPHYAILKASLHEILRDLDSLERKMQKYGHTIDGWDYVNTQFSEKINKINAKWNILETRMKLDSTALLKSILRLDVEELNQGSELTQIKKSIKSEMIAYIDKKKGMVSTTRIADMQRVSSLLGFCEKEEDSKFLKKTLLHQATHFKTGLFGNSQLRDNIISNLNPSYCPVK